MTTNMEIKLREDKNNAFNLGWIVAFLGLPRDVGQYIKCPIKVETDGFLDGWDTFAETINSSIQLGIGTDRTWMHVAMAFRSLIEIRPNRI